MSEVKTELWHSTDKVSTAEKRADLLGLLHKHAWIKFVVSSLEALKHIQNTRTHAQTHNIVSSKKLQCTPIKWMVMKKKVCLWQTGEVGWRLFSFWLDVDVCHVTKRWRLWKQSIGFQCAFCEGRSRCWSVYSLSTTPWRSITVTLSTLHSEPITFVPIKTNKTFKAVLK